MPDREIADSGVRCPLRWNRELEIELHGERAEVLWACSRCVCESNIPGDGLLNLFEVLLNECVKIACIVKAVPHQRIFASLDL